jgi:predicted transcriptional regulator
VNADRKIEFLPDGDSKNARDNEKGKLLEQLIAGYLKSSGYREVKLNLKVDGTEWDVSGEAALSNSPVIISCKCLSASVSSEPLQALAFKVTNLAYKKPTACGVMVALPRLSTDANIFWKSVAPELSARVRVIEEEVLLQELCSQRAWLCPEAIQALVRERYPGYILGDVRLVHCAKGSFWVQFVLKEGSEIPIGYYLLSPIGKEVTNDSIIHELQRLARINGSDLADTQCLNSRLDSEVGHPVVELPPAHLTVPGIGWFDYKYPAPPDCCAGREPEVKKFTDFVVDVLGRRTASRVCVITGPSGIGKSSLILKLGRQVASHGAKLVSINCISARGKGFLLSASLRLLRNLQSDKDCPNLFGITFGGLSSLPHALKEIGDRLGEKHLLPVLFFDQFETAMLDGALAEGIVELILALEELRANIIVGFAWKTDLWWPDDHVPYTAREQLRRSAFQIQVDQFGPTETNQLLGALAKEIGQQLMNDLIKEVREFSRGFPWLLKKVCWHIAEQVRRGITQQEILERKLDLRPLFEADLEMLDEAERDVLKKLAALLPNDGRTIAEFFADAPVADLLNKFVNMRLIIKQGETYGIYHDIFKEFLRTGRVPIEESYLLHVSPGKALDVLQTLADAGGEMEVGALAQATKMKVTSLYNYLRDLCSLGLTSRGKGYVSLHKDVQDVETEADLIREARRRLVRNTCARQILKLVSVGYELKIGDIVDILKKEFPSVPAKEETWKNYARFMVQWLNQVKVTGLKRIQIVGEIGSQRRLVGSETTAVYPAGFVNSTVRFVELLAKREKLKKQQLVEILGRSSKTIEKALVDGRLLGFCERLVDGSWRLTPQGLEFAAADMARKRQIFKESMMEVPFAKEFAIQISQSESKPEDIVRDMLFKRNKQISYATIVTLARILNNWCSYCGIVGTA